MDMMRELLNRNFLNLFLGQLLTHLGDAIIQVLLIAFIISNVDKPGSLIALVWFCFILPSLFISPLAGSFVDRFSRKKIMIWSSLYRGIVLIAAWSVGTFLIDKAAIGNNIIYGGIVLSLLIGIGTAFFYPAKMASVPNIVSLNTLKPANALISGSGTWALTFGAMLVSLILVKTGAMNLYIIACGIYVVAAMFLYCTNLKKDKLQNNSKFSVIADIKSTLSFLDKHKKAFNVILIAVALSLISATFYNSVNALATDTYNLNVQDLSRLKVMLGCGTLLGLFAMLLFGKFFKTNKTLVSAFLCLFLFLITSPFCKTFPLARIWLGCIGLSAAVLKITLDTVLQKVSPNFIRGKIFAFASVLETFVTLLGAALVSVIVGFVKPLIVIQAISILPALMAVLLLVFNLEFRYFVFRVTLGQIFKILFRYKFEGVDNIPPKGKVILAGNHTGKLDLFILQMATKRNLWFVTGPVAFKIPILGKMLKWFNVIPLDFGNGMEALNAAVDKLKQGEPVIIFPEAKLSDDDGISRFRRGVGIMAKKADCPIVPFAIKGGFEAWSKFTNKPKLFTQIIIQFGEPITDLERGEKEIALDIQKRVQFMKSSLDRKVFYNIKDTQYDNFLDIMKQYSDVYGQTKAVSLKTKDGYESISYIDLKRRSKTLGNYLMENANVQRGDRIAILCESRPEFAVGMFGSIQTGAITVPLDVKLTIPELTHILSDCLPKILLCSSHYLEQALEVKNNVPSIEQIFVLDDEEREHDEIMSVSKMTANLEYSFNRARSMDETALIVYTSGTTGNPKGVMISFGNIYSQMKDFEKVFKLKKDSVLLSILPLNHLLELNVGFFGMLFMGAKIVYIKSLNPKELTAAMEDCHITNMIVVPLVAKMLKNSIDKQIKKLPDNQKKLFDLMYKISKYMPCWVRRIMFKSIIDGFGGKFECFISGGAPLEADVAEFFERIGIPAFEGYGLTETSPVISTNSYEAHKIGTVGKTLPSVTAKLTPEGEIIVTGPNVMQGYYNKPEMTAEVIDEEGWFHTGDIGEIDDKGFIKITGRIKNMIVLGGGKKIFPEEVEAVLETSPLIKEFCVLSLKIKSGNKAGTEEVGAIIVPSDDLAKKTDEEIQKELEAEVKKLAEANLAPYKAPTVVLLHRDELPKTSTKKVKRKDLLEWYESL